MAVLIMAALPASTKAQGFLHAEGEKIVNGDGENIILRGIGTGNWMLQEGYMMRSGDVAPTQHEFREKLEQTIGVERTNEFYESWLNNHYRKIDVDSMAAWGFNSVRLAMHYKWYTLPIEDEPVEGENTWLEKGFELTDSLLSWCKSNQMYLILDLHGAPGGQGKNASISDYDPSKPALWENDLNKNKTIALWRKLAERYQNEPWIGGYDLINEVNWTFPEGNNSKLRELYEKITSEIRRVDNNHIIFIEGNGFANDFNELTPPWDGNLVYSFHKYWTYNDDKALDWVLKIRDQYNVPLWLGESGENSNTWFTNLVSLAEKNNIGWAWWPVKKAGINNVLQVEANEDYLRLLETWDGHGSMSSDKAYEAVITFSENHRFENCKIQYDVIDALIRQAHSIETKPFKPHSTETKIFAVDYDLGRNNFAYFDNDTADYHLNTDKFSAWNIGWAYRNDGVDIEICDDPESNGFNIGWIKKGEWLQYTINSEGEAAYQLEIRFASKEDAFILVEINGKRASKRTILTSTGSLDRYETRIIEDIILPKGEAKLKIIFESDDVNFSSFSLTNPKDISEVNFKIVSATSHQTNNDIFLNLNKSISSNQADIDANEFKLIVNNGLAQFTELLISDNNDQQLVMKAAKDLFYDDNIRVSFQGSSISSGSESLEDFIGEIVENVIYPHNEIPGKIEAESFFFNNGFQLEECSDIGGGENTAYADDRDYLDYLVNVLASGKYQLDFRVAVNQGTAEILLMHSAEDRIIPVKSVKFERTGGWQNWRTASTNVSLPKGKFIFRIYSRNGQHNLNWFSFNDATSIENHLINEEIRIYPNPASDSLRVQLPPGQNKTISLFNIDGRKMMDKITCEQSLQLNISHLPSGTYIIQITGNGLRESRKLQILR